MPAHRSEAEAEIREQVVARFRELLPGCRIIHEINTSLGGNRIDVLAVGETELLACEIKSKKDKLDRLKDQIAGMRAVTHRVFAALHEKHMRQPTERFKWMLEPAEVSAGAVCWVYPRIERDTIHPQSPLGPDWKDRGRWDRQRLGLPPGAIYMLHARELKDIVAGPLVAHSGGVSKLAVDQCNDLIRHCMTGAQIDKAICDALRSRTCCAEADPAHVVGTKPMKQGALL